MLSLLKILWIIGITAEGMTGALAAGRRKMDLFGVAVLASVTAIGGGSIRDVLLGHYPLTWVAEPQYLVLVVVASFVTVSMPFLLENFRVVFLVLDAVGLSVFAVIGTQVALGLGHGFVIAVVSAVVTGVFGGVIRDLLSNQIPLVFQEELYASVAVLATCVYFLLRALGASDSVTVIVSILVAVTVRLLAIWRGWSLPIFDYQERS
ncbi:trimeric intracellular cation channel family protein [Corynebacterium epidermidicanis]|uniref:Putative membrane protein n=1 Tax=Corynebacterium epidermidicanis TaxID=1050174 RepID=A0A0G3GME6_9CORY|nr:trimeric intracellular cation channel family protein [Corynebacterium epidermidicanis]AKK02406.1 putative membrane protein [Corynebacterium epidermidicanis]